MRNCVVAQPFLRKLLRWSACAIAAANCCNAQAQTFDITLPSLNVRQTFTDNADLDPVDGRFEAITQISLSGGLGIEGRGARVRGSLRYAPTFVIFAGDRESNTLRHSLRASGSAEVVENTVFVDVYATASEQVISPFGQLPADPTLPNRNSTLVFNYGISPYAEGTLGGSVDYLARLNYSGSKNDESDDFEFQNLSGLVRLEGSTRFTRLGWALTAAARADDYENSLRVGNYGVAASLFYAVTPYFTLRGNAGVEVQNYASAEKQRSSLYGVGFDWQPTDRTTVAAGVENRFFGNAYRVLVQHRTQRTVWTYSHNYGISEASGYSAVSLGTNFDLFFRQFESVEPDPLRREQLVLDFLRANGIPADQQAVAGFLTTNVQLQESQNLGVAWVGRRNTVTLAASQTRNSSLIRYLELDNNFDNETYVRQQGIGMNFSRRLTPTSSLGLSLSQQRSTSVDDVFATKQTRTAVNWGTAISNRATLNVSARHVTFDSPTRPYTENAVVANFNLRF